MIEIETIRLKFPLKTKGSLLGELPTLTSF